MRPFKLQLAAVLVGAAVMFAIPSGCGQPRREAAQDPEGVAPVGGYALFGAQCPYGSFNDPVPVRLKAIDCPLPVQQMTLAEPLKPLVFTSDCKHRTLTTRGRFRSMVDSTWAILPDNSFDFTMEFGTAHLTTDGSGNDSCEIPLMVNLWGKVDCVSENDDKALISLESRWDQRVYPSPTPWVPPSPTFTTIPVVVMVPSPGPSGVPTPVPSIWPSPSPLPIPSPSPQPKPPKNACKIPPGCYLYATTQVRQCQ